jgi:hypothetical protein
MVALFLYPLTAQALCPLLIGVGKGTRRKPIARDLSRDALGKSLDFRLLHGARAFPWPTLVSKLVVLRARRRDRDGHKRPRRHQPICVEAIKEHQRERPDCRITTASGLRSSTLSPDRHGRAPLPRVPPRMKRVTVTRHTFSESINVSDQIVGSPLLQACGAQLRRLRFRAHARCRQPGENNPHVEACRIRPVRQGDALVGGRSAVRPALGYDLGAREEADAVLAILVKVAES